MLLFGELPHNQPICSVILGPYHKPAHLRTIVKRRGNEMLDILKPHLHRL
jgi:hypothetical protein